jgi:general secretion pathway protein K
MPGTSRNARPAPRGLALVTVLWAAMLLSLLALGLGRTGGTGTALVFNQIESARAEALADAGVALAVLGLLDEEDPWRADRRERVIAFAGGELRIRIEDEHGKLDLNSASLDLIEALLEGQGVSADDARALAAAIDDYSLPTGPLGGRFVRVSQLQLVPGIDSALYETLRPASTVHTGSPGLDPYYASPVLLDALPGLDAALRERLLAAAGVPDDALDRELEEVLGEHVAWSPETHLTILVEARTEGGAVFLREATLGLPPLADLFLAVLEWRRGEAIEP